METAEILHILNTGNLTIAGMLPWSSNYTFLATICGRSPSSDEEQEIEAVYKPRAGERPLWDFPQGTLCLRERAAYLTSSALGWHLIPPTVLRKGPNGLGSFQLFIDHDPERHYFTIEGNPAYADALQQLTLLDIIINNADRKGGHILLEERPDGSERLWGIDHGIGFHSDYKLRTVVWEFAGLPIPDTLLANIDHFCHNLATNHQNMRGQLLELLSRSEVDALEQRTNRLLHQKIFPYPGPGRHYPWPPV